MPSRAQRLLFTSLTLAASAGVLVTIAAQTRTAQAQAEAAPSKPAARSKVGSSCTCCAALTPLSEWPAGVDVFNGQKHETVILKLLPEGTAVKKGDVVCQLDASDLVDLDENSPLKEKHAEVAFQEAKLTREVAEIAVTEYEGVYKQEEQLALAEVEFAKADVKRARGFFDDARQQFDAGQIEKARLIVAELGAERAVVGLELAETKLKVLREYTKEKHIKELNSEVAKTRSVELAKQAAWELERAKAEKLKRDIERHTLRAPADGIVRHAQGVGPDGRPRTEEGAIVKYRQWILRVVTPDANKSAP